METSVNAGAIIMSTSRNACVDPATLRAALVQHAPTLADLVTKPTSHQKSLQRAAFRAGSTPRGYIWRELGQDDKGALILVLVKEDSDAVSRDYRADGTAWVAVDENGAWIDSPGTNEVEARAVATIKDHYVKGRGILGSEELAQLVRRACETARGVMLRPGVFFVPASHAALLAGVDAAFEVARTGTTLIRVAVGGDAATAMAKPAERTLWDELTTLQTTLAERKANSATSGRGLRCDGIHNMVAELSALRERADLMRVCLQANVADLEEAALALEKEALEALCNLGKE